MLAVACGGTSPGPKGPKDSAEPVDTATTPEDTAPTSVDDTGTPAPVVFHASLRKPDGTIGLVRWLDVEANEAVRLDLSWSDGSHGGAKSESELATVQSLPILGLRPARTYEVTITATAEDGRSSEVVLELVSDDLPAVWPELDVRAHDKARMEPGLTLMSIFGPDGELYAAVYDEDLEVVWFDDRYWFDARRTATNGALFGLTGWGVSEVHFTGDEVQSWARTGVPGAIPIVYDLHHEAYPMDDGSVLTLSSATRNVLAYPTSYLDPASSMAPGRVKTPVVYQFAADGSTLMDVDLGDVLDLKRVGFDALSEDNGASDWGHANAVIPHPDGGVLVSVRHQDCVVKLNAAGELEWIAGNPEGWAAEFEPYLLEQTTEFDWFYHPHAPEWDNGRMLLFDNHNWGGTPYGRPPATEPRSSVVEVEIDPVAMTITLLNRWSDFGPGTPIFSKAYGDADRQPQTGNILAQFGLVIDEDGFTADTMVGAEENLLRIIEFDPADSANPMLDMRLHGGFSGARVERIESLESLVD